MNLEKYMVMVVDDKKAVLQALEDWVEKKMIIGGEEIQVELLTAHVEVTEINGKYAFSHNTIENLNNLCQKPFHLMLLDFGYVKKGMDAVAEILKLHERQPEKHVREVIDEVVLNPSHLVKRCKEERLPKIEKSFVNHKGSLIIYTFLPNEIERHYTSADVRENITNAHFINANIKVIDTRKELFNNSQFDIINKERKEYYPFLISKYLSKVIQLEIAEILFSNTKQHKVNLKRVKRNNRIITFTTILTSLVAGVLIPSLSDSIKSGDYKIATAFLVTTSLMVVILSVGNKFLEKDNASILRK